MTKVHIIVYLFSLIVTMLIFFCQMAFLLTALELWFLLHLQVLPSLQPAIVYFPDSSQWLSRAVPKSNRKEFVCKVEEMFDQLSGPVVFICGQNKVENGSKEKEKLVSFFFLIEKCGYDCLDSIGQSSNDFYLF